MATSVAANGTRYAEYVNPQWVRLLDLLGMNVRYTRCGGVELHTAEGDRILDFLSGYCVHNHSAVIFLRLFAPFTLGCSVKCWSCGCFSRNVF